MKLIFLDFDGVISSEEKHFQCFDRTLLERLEDIIIRSDKIKPSDPTYIVITSTWRKRYSILGMQGLFKTQGDRYGCFCPYPYPFKFTERIIGITPFFDMHKEEDRAAGRPWGRGAEISYWLETAQENGLQMTSYVVLDDDTADIPPHRDRQVVTHSRKGLTDEDVGKAVKILDTPL